MRYSRLGMSETANPAHAGCDPWGKGDWAENRPGARLVAVPSTSTFTSTSTTAFDGPAGSHHSSHRARPSREGPRQGAPAFPRDLTPGPSPQAERGAGGSRAITKTCSRSAYCCGRPHPRPLSASGPQAERGVCGSRAITKTCSRSAYCCGRPHPRPLSASGEGCRRVSRSRQPVGSIAAMRASAVDVVQDLFVFQSEHALAVVQQELIALCIQVHPTAV